MESGALLDLVLGVWGALRGMLKGMKNGASPNEAPFYRVQYIEGAK
jgi:hypothetical protein